MLETKDLILDKAKFSDWEAMYQNVWCHPESAKYMLWNVTTSAENAKIRIEKTIAFQKEHDTYFVYDKVTGQAIGFAGVEELSPGVCTEVGICFGPDYVGKGYGKQVLACLMEYCKLKYGAEEFRCSAREKNIASNKVIQSFGFQLFDTETKVDDRDGKTYNLLQYQLKFTES